MHRKETKRWLYLYNGKELEVWGETEKEAIETLRAYGFNDVHPMALSEIKPGKNDVEPIE